MKEITLEARVENIERVTAFVDEALEELGCSMRSQMQIDVAIDEIFGNIARYAYAPAGGPATVQMDFDPAAGMVSLTFRDQGIPYNPETKEDPDTTLPAEERAIGGLGIFLVKKTMDAMTYHREGDSNVLVIRKKI